MPETCARVVQRCSSHVLLKKNAAGSTHLSCSSLLAGSLFRGALLPGSCLRLLPCGFHRLLLRHLTGSCLSFLVCTETP